MLDVNFWQERYDSGNTPWDLGGASPHFVELLESHADELPPGKMAVLGAGRGHDAALFAAAGFDVVGFDYAPGAIQESSARYGDRVRFEQADIFDPALTTPGSEFHQAFDYVLEHTCFCAIHPRQRTAYVETAAGLLKPGGKLIGIFWEHGDTDGPPYSTTETDLDQHFAGRFERLRLETRQPVSDRTGLERVGIFRRVS